MQKQHSGRYSALLGLLEGVARHLKAVRLAERTLLLACVALGVPVAAVLCELTFHPTVPAIASAFHLMLWAVYAAGVAACLVLVAGVLRRRLSHEQVAVHIEGKFPQLRNSLINSVQLGKDDLAVSPVLVERVIADTLRESKAFRLNESVNKRRLARTGGASFFCAAVFALLLLGASYNERLANAIERLLNPFHYTPVVGSVKIVSVEPGDTRIFHGEDLAVSATFQTAKKDIDGLILYAPDHKADPTARQMSPVADDKLAYCIKDVRSPFEYRLKIGDSETRWFSVTVASRPAVERLDIAYRFPSYTGMADVLEEDARGDIRAVVGTIATVRVASTKDIAKGHVLLGGDTILPLEPDAENPPFGSASITIKNDSFYSIRIEDSDGYANKDPISRTITALPDRKPVIRFTHDRKEITAAPGDTLKLALRAADDYGLSEVAIFFQDAEDAPIRRLRDWPGLRRKEFAATHDWHLDARKYGPGTKITYYAEATDNAVPASGRAATPKYTIKIEDPARKIASRQKALGDWERRLTEILKAQRMARAEAADARALALDARREAGADLKLKQAAIRQYTIALAEKIDPAGSLTRRVKEVLFYLT
ncbi:MAG: DUF4175 family protein, partial [Planctomycetes bacterium]|nr:DUF4175 family protein [Planctomycetota bacterium]